MAELKAILEGTKELLLVLLSFYIHRNVGYLCFITYDLDLFQQNYIAVKAQWFDCKSRKRKVKKMFKVSVYKFFSSDYFWSNIELAIYARRKGKICIMIGRFAQVNMKTWQWYDIEYLIRWSAKKILFPFIRNMRHIAQGHRNFVTNEETEQTEIRLR